MAETSRISRGKPFCAVGFCYVTDHFRPDIDLVTCRYHYPSVFWFVLFTAVFFSLCKDLIRIYMAQLALVLDYLHASGVIYRDMKMENVLVTPQVRSSTDRRAMG